MMRVEMKNIQLTAMPIIEVKDCNQFAEKCLSTKVILLQLRLKLQKHQRFAKTVKSNPTCFFFQNFFFQ
jgi:hypothetical protein